jgi:mannose-6-phosphate isomerase-like protein (cupin superfamily)
MPSPVRRIVTGHDDAGTAMVIMDASAPNVRVREASGIVSTLLWATDESPADIAGDADRAARISGVAPPQNGSVFRIVDFPPLGSGGRVEHAAVLKEMGLGDQAGAGPQTGAGGHARSARSPFMHRTRSVDYAIVMSGEIDMLLDQSEVHLKAGDVLVQQGTNHAWENHGTEVCRIAFVLIDAKAPPQWHGADH